MEPVEKPNEVREEVSAREEPREQPVPIEIEDDPIEVIEDESQNEPTESENEPSEHHIEPMESDEPMELQESPMESQEAPVEPQERSMKPQQEPEVSGEHIEPQEGSKKPQQGPMESQEEPMEPKERPIEHEEEPEKSVRSIKLEGPDEPMEQSQASNTENDNTARFELGQDVWIMHNALHYVFSYLNSTDLMRVTEVCRLWNMAIYSDNRLWRSVRFKACNIHFDKLVEFLEKHNTVELSLVDCRFANNDPTYLLIHLQKVPSLRKLEINKVPLKLVELLPEVNTKLQEITVSITDFSNNCLQLSSFKKLQDLQKFTLKLDDRRGVCSFDVLSNLKNLKHLSLTYVPDFRRYQLNLFKELPKLTSLELGYCETIPQLFYTEILPHLKLTKLYLHNIKNDEDVAPILQALKDITTLKELELTNVHVDKQFYAGLLLCNSLKKVFISPKYKIKSLFEGIEVIGRLNLTKFTLVFTNRHIQFYKRLYDASADKNNFLTQNLSLNASTYAQNLLNILKAGDAKKFIKRLQKVLNNVYLYKYANISVVLREQQSPGPHAFDRYGRGYFDFGNWGAPFFNPFPPRAGDRHDFRDEEIPFGGLPFNRPGDENHIFEAIRAANNLPEALRAAFALLPRIPPRPPRAQNVPNAAPLQNAEANNQDNVVEALRAAFAPLPPRIPPPPPHAQNLPNPAPPQNAGANNRDPRQPHQPRQPQDLRLPEFFANLHRGGERAPPNPPRDRANAPNPPRNDENLPQLQRRNGRDRANRHNPPRDRVNLPNPQIRPRDEGNQIDRLLRHIGRVFLVDRGNLPNNRRNRVDLPNPPRDRANLPNRQIRDRVEQNPLDRILRFFRPGLGDRGNLPNNRRNRVDFPNPPRDRANLPNRQIRDRIEQNPLDRLLRLFRPDLGDRGNLPNPPRNLPNPPVERANLPNPEVRHQIEPYQIDRILRYIRHALPRDRNDVPNPRARNVLNPQRRQQIDRLLRLLRQLVPRVRNLALNPQRDEVILANNQRRMLIDRLLRILRQVPQMEQPQHPPIVVGDQANPEVDNPPEVVDNENNPPVVVANENNPPEVVANENNPLNVARNEVNLPEVVRDGNYPQFVRMEDHHRCC